jgi:hypothetical protein
MFDEFGDPIDPSAYDFGTSTGADSFGGGDISSLANIGGGLVSTAFSPAKILGGSGNPGRLMRGGAGAMVAAGTGARIAMRKVWAMTKQLGPELVAGALGYTASDLVSALISSGVMTRKRRARGISGRDIRTTKRVCRFAASLNHTLSHCGPHPRRRAKAC